MKIKFEHVENFRQKVLLENSEVGVRLITFYLALDEAHLKLIKNQKKVVWNTNKNIFF